MKTQILQNEKKMIRISEKYFLRLLYEIRNNIYVGPMNLCNIKYHVCREYAIYDTLLLQIYSFEKQKYLLEMLLLFFFFFVVVLKVKK